MELATIPSLLETPASFASPPAYDPLNFRQRVVSNPIDKKATFGRRTKIKNFYEKQNDHIDNLLKPLENHAVDAEEDEKSIEKKKEYVIYLNIGLCFILAGVQLYAAISSLSLALFATAMDVVFDPFANILLTVLHRKSKKLDTNKWPVGGSRLGNAGNVAFSAIMICVSAVLVVESARDIATHDPNEVERLYLPSLIAVAISFLVKAGLAILNFSLRKRSSQINMLWKDCRNDLFINGFGIFASAAGAVIRWWIDPTGAIIISLFTIFAWCRAAFNEFQLLCGISANSEFLQLITYQSMIHHPLIQSIDSVRAYHSGEKLMVEVDIVMSPEVQLSWSHDISQALQDKIEALANVERSHVHVDYEVSHSPEHRKKQ